MGFDVVAFINGLWSQHSLLVVLSGLLLLALWRSGFFKRLFRIIEEMMFNNWQLALLGAMAIALSLASGYTTFDGLRNFTSAPLLSFLITFGIQGVMLIVAWLIGESFATGMNQRRVGAKGFTPREASIGMVLGVAFAALAFYWVLTQTSAVGFNRAAGLVADWARFADVALYFLIALVLIAVIAFNFRRGGDISTPYVQSIRLIAKNSVLWVMLLAAMTASVFFSFDSHFNAIFPADQRARAAEIRTLNQVGRIVVDIGERAQKVQLAEAERLFDTDGWKAYDAHLSNLADQAKGSQAEIEAYFIQKMEERRRGIAEQQERISGAERNQTALLRRRDELEAELQRIEPGIGNLEGDLAKAQATFNETRQAIAAKRIDASAEDGGVEGTRKRGRGPVYRQRMDELNDLQRKLSITDEPRLEEARRQRDRVSARIVGIKREIATINGEVAKYTGERQTAEQRIKAAETTGGDTEGKVDPARVLPAFERARTAFRQQPDAERLAAVQAQCSALLNAMLSTPAAKDRVRAIDCDPSTAAEAAGRLFALNAGLAAFQAQCAGGSKMPQNANTDGLLSFGRQCLQDSGLVSQEATDLGGRLQGIEMNRDDKAHRFVVTWNAFLDGNRLAYLAMVLAIGVDALVFMAGLFGAAAVKSPLTDLEGRDALSATHLEQVIDGALRTTADPLGTIRAILKLSEPFSGERGFASVVELGGGHRFDDVRSVLVAGASIGAVKLADNSRFLVSVGLAKYFYIAATKKWPTAKATVDQNDVSEVIGVALEPEISGNAAFVLSHLRALAEDGRYVARVDLDAIPQGDGRDLVRNVMNAGVALGKVTPRKSQTRGLLKFRRKAHAKGEASAYDVHGDLFKTLLFYRADPSNRDRTSHRTIAPQTTGAFPIASNKQLPPPNTYHNGGTNKSDQELEAHFRLELISTIGLSKGALEHLWDTRTADEALAAANILKNQARLRPSLARELRRIEHDRLIAIKARREILASQFESDGGALALLNGVAIEIEKKVPALMLLPEAGLVDRLVSTLEQASGEGRLSDDERFLLTKLRQLKEFLSCINPSNSSDWKRVAQHMEQLSDAAPTHANGPGDGTYH